MAVRDGRSDVKQKTTGFRGPLMVQSLTSAKSKFLSLNKELLEYLGITATEDEVFRNYNYNEEQRREHLLERAEEFNSKHNQHH